MPMRVRFCARVGIYASVVGCVRAYVCTRVCVCVCVCCVVNVVVCCVGNVVVLCFVHCVL